MQRVFFGECTKARAAFIDAQIESLTQKSVAREGRTEVKRQQEAARGSKRKRLGLLWLGGYALGFAGVSLPEVEP